MLLTYKLSTGAQFAPTTPAIEAHSSSCLLAAGLQVEGLTRGNKTW
jgi:hypothetical protein